MEWPWTKSGRDKIRVPPHVRFGDDWKDAKIAGCDCEKIGIAEQRLNDLVFQQQRPGDRVNRMARLRWIDPVARALFCDRLFLIAPGNVSCRGRAKSSGLKPARNRQFA